MMRAAAEMDFEQAAAIRDQIAALRGEGGRPSHLKKGKRGRTNGGSSGRIPRPGR